MIYKEHSSDNYSLRENEICDQTFFCNVMDALGWLIQCPSQLPSSFSSQLGNAKNNFSDSSEARILPVTKIH